MTREELNQDKQKKIIDEQRREKRKKITILIFKLSIALIAFFLLFYCYTTYVSTSSLVVKEKRIVNSKIPANFDGLKIIHFSDLHYGTTVFSDQVSRIVKEINKRKPDIVVFTGDLIDKDFELSTEEQEKLSKLLDKIDVKLGKYAVPGEEDDSEFYTILKQSDFTILNNNYELIYYNDVSPILLVGLDSYLDGKYDINKAYEYFSDSAHDRNIFTIGLVHEPDIVDKILEKYPTDLFLAGHSHNGNIRIPYFGALQKVDGAKKYDQEYYKVKDSDLYISSGLETNGPGFRLFCRPSFNFFRVSVK